jgi:dTDP-4-dehydrorhamnose reductase
MKILVLGGEGMLGHKVFQTLRANFDQVACTLRGKLTDPFYTRFPLFRGQDVVEEFNALDFAALEQMLGDRKPDAVVNCVGIVSQRAEAKAHYPSVGLNSFLPHFLAHTCAPWGGRVVHFSTDCVFSGKDGGYTEDSPSDAQDLYGKSKYLGEVAVANGLTLRTSIIGRELAEFRSLLEWFMSQRGKTVRGFRRVLYSGVTTNYMAGLVARILAEFPDLHGLYQVTGQTLSKHDLLGLLRDAYGLDIEIVPDDDAFSDRSMIGERFVQKTGLVCPPWPELVAQLVNDPTPYEQWR